MSAPHNQRKRYRVCGLHLGSAIAFPELPQIADAAEDFAADVEFDLGGTLSESDQGEAVMSWNQSDGTPWLSYLKTRDGYRIHYRELADFLLDRRGRRVRCIAPPQTAPETIRHLFLDQVIPPLLNLRGREALHASAILSPKGACAFIGQSGLGKSTLAATFHVAGYPVLCDDCLLLKDDGDQISVEPAYPGLRLWDDSRGILFGDAQASLPVAQDIAKRRIVLSRASSAAKDFESLCAIYTLQQPEDGAPVTAPSIEALSVREAFMELVECAFRLDLSDRSMIVRQMGVLERVAKEVPFRRLNLPDDLGGLAAARELVLQDLGLAASR